jgi:hypothetical protein
MGDILLTVPWPCGDRDCAQGWHLAQYSTDDTSGEYIADDFCDGDWTPCDEGDVPNALAEQRAWRDYYRHVAETAEDPLSEFTVGLPGKEEKRWTAVFAETELSGRYGLLFKGAWRRGRGERFGGGELPRNVANYLELEPTVEPPRRYYCREFATVDELTQRGITERVERLNARTVRVWFAVEEEVPVSEWLLARRLKRAAKAALARAEHDVRVLEGGEGGEEDDHAGDGPAVPGAQGE